MVEVANRAGMATARPNAVVSRAWLTPLASSSGRPRALLVAMALKAAVTSISPVTAMRNVFGDSFFYILYFQEPGVADADVSLLRLALENLLANAWKYTGKRDDALIEFFAEPLPAWKRASRRACRRTGRLGRGRRRAGRRRYGSSRRLRPTSAVPRRWPETLRTSSMRPMIQK